MPFLLSKQAPDYPAVIRIHFLPEGAAKDCYSLFEEDLDVEHFFLPLPLSFFLRRNAQQ
ncbi:hypothetical protein [Enhydrobacter sp.]|uniref:hypothetical protein n=1 Tax=Enhydrobacter sp. TaxID=1894999 RepID=UPI002603E18B|nr:hypothetical protein [Enhydrobacter sp.]